MASHVPSTLAHCPHCVFPPAATHGCTNQSKDAEQFSYSLEILQQPRAARSFGQSDYDRRFIDPPPIIKMTKQSPDSTEQDYTFIMTAKLCNEDGTEYTLESKDEGRMSPKNQSMLGQNACNSLFAEDQNGQGWFFWFSELSVREPGKYRLEFTVFKITILPKVQSGRSPEVAVTTSDVFQVYSAKDFKGYEGCTPLTIWLKGKGAIFTRAGGKRHRSDADSDDSTPSSKRKSIKDLDLW
ncbi:unnamed protein product [Fusarium langsethiae]|nr:unnamed protein product [Fusarium langsethiae]